MSSRSIRIGFVRDRRRAVGSRHLALFHLLREKARGRREICVGYLGFDRAALERLRESGKRLDVTVVGILRLGPDVSPALAKDVFGRLRVIGATWGDERTVAAARSTTSLT